VRDCTVERRIAFLGGWAALTVARKEGRERRRRRGR